MTKQQERARARRRYERQQATLAQRESDRARRLRVAVIMGTVVAVVGVLAVLGAMFADEQPAAPRRRPRAASLPPTALGTAAQLTLPDKRPRRARPTSRP